MTQGTGWGGDGGPYGNGPYGNGPYGSGPYGNGPQGPYGWGGWTPPLPPKPGVIPLAPLDLGGILGGAFATLGRYWKQLFGVALTVYGAAMLAVAAAAAVAYGAVGDHLPKVFDPPYDVDPSWTDIRPLLIAFGCVWAFGMLALLAATAMIQATCPAIVQDAVLGRPATFGAIWRRASARIPAVLGTVVISALISLVPMVLLLAGFGAILFTYVALDGSGGAAWLIPLGFLGALAFAPLAVWLWVRFSLAPAAAVIESQGPLAALRRSADLVRGAWWRIFGISLLAYVMAAVTSMVIQQLVNVVGLFPGMIGASDVDGDPTAAQLLVAVGGYLLLVLFSQLISQLITTTFPQLVLNLLYMDQRIRKENLAAALIEAAAVPPAR
ncbi:hypothetical protein ACFWNG_13095 [Streptomyces sp. NPDC058391]|uniref:hypothetical protein n=1 Tax=Streptomyces sp. NPDC058391 TaxID=3346476 RepID=UPI0036490EFA